MVCHRCAACFCIGRKNTSTLGHGYMSDPRRFGKIVSLWAIRHRTTEHFTSNVVCAERFIEVTRLVREGTVDSCLRSCAETIFIVNFQTQNVHLRV